MLFGKEHGFLDRAGLADVAGHARYLRGGEGLDTDAEVGAEQVTLRPLPQRV